MFCTSCGTSISENHAFCSKCGQPVTRPPATTRPGDITIDARPAQPTPSSHTSTPTTQYRPTPAPPPLPTPSPQPAGSPVYVTQQVQVASPVMLRPLKSVGLAVFLGLLFGPFGLFYASVTGGIVMLMGGIIATASTYGVAGPFVWIACAVWGGIAASNYNSALMASNASPMQINRY